MEIRDQFQQALGGYIDSKREAFKWSPAFAIFALLSLGATGIKSLMVGDPDYLGGRETVEKIFRANLIRLIIMLVIVVLFVIFFAKTWKGVKSSGEQLIYTAACGIVVVLFTVFAWMPVLSIAEELRDPRTVTLEKYILTESGKDKYLVFDDQGDSILLLIPEDDHSELKKGKVTNNHSSRAWILLEDAGDSYKNTVMFEGELTVTYYQNSVVLDSLIQNAVARST